MKLEFNRRTSSTEDINQTKTYRKGWVRHMGNIITAMIILSSFVGVTVFSAETAKTKMTRKHMAMQVELTDEQRKSMATMHEKMAVCLRSTKTVSDCHDEMKTDCQQMMGQEGCPMMKSMKGMMRGGGVMQKSATKTDAKSETKSDTQDKK